MASPERVVRETEREREVMVPFMTWSLKSHTVTFIILVIRSESLSLEHTQGEGDSDPSLKEGEYYRIPWTDLKTTAI